MESDNATKINEAKEESDKDESSAEKNEKTVDAAAGAAAKEKGEKTESEKTNMSEHTHTENVKNEAAPISENLDELSSLEQEIAKMHNAFVSSGQSPTNVTSVSEGTACPFVTAPGTQNAEKTVAPLTVDLSVASLTSEQALKETAALLETGNDVETKLNTSHPLDEVDLIAVLKGTDSSHEQAHDDDVDKSKSNSTSLCGRDSLDMGVTIEGEGQYEIMEVVDDENDELGNDNFTKQTAVTAKSKPPNMLNKSMAVSGKNKMSPEQERAVALEQIANLRPKHSRRKQELKPTDIVNTLNDDWNDYDSSNDVTIGKSKLPKKLTRDTMKAQLNVTIPAANNSTNISNSNTSSSSGGATTAQKASISASAAEQASPQLEVTGFKRTRVIKPKVIWDPDAPESQKSYAQYASAKTLPSATESPSTSPTLTTRSTPLATTRIPMVMLAKKDVTIIATKKIRPATPKEKHSTSSPVERKPSPVKPISVSPAVTPKQDATKRRSETPSLNGTSSSAGKKKKVSSEIDRLMGDEGAANMIQAIEHKRRAIAVQVSSEQSKAELQKPIMRKRALTICEKPAKWEASTTPTKKETIPKVKRAAAAAAAAKPRAADTWDYVYQQQASDDSMIIRRRSNSSYSSTASLRRLSIDKANISDSESTPQPSSKITSAATTSAGTPDDAFTFAKPVNKATSAPNKMVGKRQNSPTTIAANTIAADMKRAMRGSSITRSNVEKANPKESNAAFEITVRKLDKIAQIVVNTTQRSKIAHTYNVQLLNKLNETLGKLAKNNEFNTVLLNGSGAQFCQGVELHELCVGTLEKRKNYATQLAAAVKTYLRTLVTFPKPLVVCINGNLKNLGVMQLPLFDFVVSSDKSTFETTYAKLGQTPEALCLWHEAPVSNTVKKRLFLLGEKLTLAEMGGTTGLINKSAAPSKVLDEAVSIAKRISETTADNYYSCIKRHTFTKLVEAMKSSDDEFKIITEQWTSATFSENVKNNN